MRRFLIAAAMAIGLIALWAAILPLTAKPAPANSAPATPASANAAPATPASSIVSKALFLCRGEHGIDRACAASLARALVLEASDHAPTPVSDRICHADPQAFSSADRHG
jgi:hypothetical protein